jgi:multidrug efflux pump subunit AcrB
VSPVPGDQCAKYLDRFSGQTVGLYREADKLLPIIVRPPEVERASVDNVRDVQVCSPVQNIWVPVRQVAQRFETGWSDQIVRRKDRIRTITAQCDPATGDASALFDVVRPRIEAIELPPGYAMEWGGKYENSGDAQASLLKLLPLSFLAMIVVVIVLFNDLRQPAVIESCLGRIRPVSLATITTILGMLPLVLDAFFVDMAVTIMFGLAFATVLTLVAVPVLYAIFFRVENAPA